MQREVSSCKTYNYGDAVYWDARYAEQADNCFDWFQPYSELQPFIRLYIPDFSSRVLMVGCGNALMSEDMVMDGYEEIMNIDISSVAIDMMRRKHEQVPQLKYMQMDVRDMSFFDDQSYDSIVDKGMLDSLMCGNDARGSAARMLGEVSRILKPGGVYLLISYGDPKGRMPHLNQPGFNWEIVLYIKPRPGFKKASRKGSMRSPLEPVQLTRKGLLPSSFVMEDVNSHFIYVCRKASHS